MSRRVLNVITTLELYRNYKCLYNFEQVCTTSYIYFETVLLPRRLSPRLGELAKLLRSCISPRQARAKSCFYNSKCLRCIYSDCPQADLSAVRTLVVLSRWIGIALWCTLLHLLIEICLLQNTIIRYFFPKSVVRVEGSIGRFHRSSKRERGEGRGHCVQVITDA